MSFKRTLSFSKPKFSASSIHEQDEMAQEISQGGAVHSLDAPTFVDENVLKVKYELTDCPADSVCVFSDRAQVTRTIEYIAPKIEEEKKEGTNDRVGCVRITISGLPQNTEDSSIRISKRTGDATILEVSVENSVQKILKKEDQEKEKEKEKETPEGEEKPDETFEKKQEKLIQELSKKRKLLTEELSRLEKEKIWINSYSNQRNHFSGCAKLSIQEAKKFMDFQQEKMKHYDQKKHQLNQELSLLEKKRTNLVETKNIKSVHLLLEEAEGPLLFSLSYVVTNASWKPSYDIRVDPSDLDKVELSYFAIIRNSTSDDWKDVKLSLSTAQPQVGGFPPPLNTSYVGFGYQTYTTKSVFGGFEESEDYDDRLVMELEQNTTFTSFKIPRITTINSDSQPHKVTINIFELKSSFSYIIAPKLSEHAYLRSTSINSTGFPFLAGKANVFMNDTFVANSELKNTNSGDEITLYLGSDPMVTVEYKENQFKEKKGFVSKTTSTKYSHSIVVKNSKSTEVKCSIFDQLPKSQDDKVKVTVLQPKIEEKEREGGCTLNNLNNLKWQITIPPSKSFETTFEYQIEHPNDQTVSIH